MITAQDVKTLEKTFATKKDLKNLEKKMDIKFATKKDLKNLDEKIDKRFIQVGMEFHHTNERIDFLAEKMLDMSESIESLKVSMDYITGKYKEREVKDHIGSMVQARHTRQLKQIATHIDIQLED